tara:strand:- start:372 stop:611 length:240 start_codon:yes stop_codon:yes gene_type:complete
MYTMLPYLPEEIVDIIIEFSDYVKLHKKNFQPALQDIIQMNNILTTISPSIAYTCWNDYGWNKYTNLMHYPDNNFNESA